MYTLKMQDTVGNGISKPGTLVECLKLMRRLSRRLGMTGRILRPDGSDIRDVSRRMCWRLP